MINTGLGHDAADFLTQNRRIDRRFGALKPLIPVDVTAADSRMDIFKENTFRADLRLRYFRNTNIIGVVDLVDKFMMGIPVISTRPHCSSTWSCRQFSYYPAWNQFASIHQD
jgi:hypothetical protein